MNPMDRETWEEVEPLLERVFDMDVEERSRFLDEIGSRDPAMRRRLLELLDADEAAEGFLSEPLLPLAEDSTPRLEKLGQYRLLRPIGQGGMGTVYLAERADGQYQQQVAIKVLSSQAGNEELRARFLRERQIQAQLAHPNIARLLDGGVSDEGLPYLVMEHVEGRSITDYCRDKGLDLDGRIELFLKVCEAVAYANRNLVVHRDLKPGNILVSAAGEVKLLDFGIAKLIEPGSDGSATETSSRLFTLHYAAPEQMLGKPVTTATDVYSLGLVLYELLTGERPFEDRTSPLERLRLVLETAPKAPSRAAGASARIDADLDAICLKALRPEPEQRYLTAEGLRDDLIRRRESRPVSARHGSNAYRFRKFARRHALMLSAASVVILSLAAGAGFSIRQARLTARERDRARAINDFLVHDLLRAATPERTRGDELKVTEVLGAASRRIGASFEDQPELEADLRLALGRSYLSLGTNEEALGHMKRALELRVRELGDNHPETQSARSELAEAYLAEGSPAEARPLLETALIGQRASLGPDSLDALATEGRMAELLLQEGHYLAAESLSADVLRRLEREHAGAWREALLLRAILGTALNQQRKDSESETVLRETLTLQREWLGPTHPDTLATIVQLVESLRRLQRFEEGVPLAEEAFQIHEQVYGADHPETLRMMTLVARLEWYEDSAHAQELLLEVLARSRKSLGAEHPMTLQTLMSLAQNAKMLKSHDVAESRYRESIALSRRIYGDEHPTTLRALRFYGVFLNENGRTRDARPVFREIVAISERMAAKEDADATFLSDYAWLLMTYVPPDMRDPARAIPLAERAVALTDRKQVEFLHSLARAYRQTGRLDEGIATLREIYTLPDSVHRYDVERDMIEYLEAKGDPGAVEVFLRENLERRTKVRHPTDGLIAQTHRLLGLHYSKVGRYGDAEKELMTAVELLLDRRSPSHWEVARAESELGEVLLEQGRYAEARELLERSHENLQGEDDILPAARARLSRLEEAVSGPGK